MPEFLTSAFAAPGPVSPLALFLRLATALVFGAAVAWIYRRARGSEAVHGSFPGTLVLLAVLIAIVTQVIGDNIARAFSLVGALSIVRFRTVVRDTQDTAYVIFAVVIGMAVGAQHLWVASIGLVVVGVAAWLLCRPAVRRLERADEWLLQLRLNAGLDAQATLDRVASAQLARRDLASIETARQGLALDVVFHLVLRPETRPEQLVQDLNRTEGVQAVSLKRRELEAD